MIEILPLPAFMRLAGGSNSSESERNREETERKRERELYVPHTHYTEHIPVLIVRACLGSVWGTIVSINFSF